MAGYIICLKTDVDHHLLRFEKFKTSRLFSKLLCDKSMLLYLL